MGDMAEWQEWQSGVQVEKCDKVNYPHYCVDANNATKQEKQNVMEQEKQDATKQDVCKDCHKEHSGPSRPPNCRIV
jgi:hypothetical protein